MSAHHHVSFALFRMITSDVLTVYRIRMICILGTQSLQFSDKHTVKGQYFLRLLDTHGSGGKSGVPENIFKEIFYVCWQCGRHMTERVSSSHHEDADLGDMTCINRKSAVDAGAAGSGDTFHGHKNKVERVPIPFPELEPLYM